MRLGLVKKVYFGWTGVGEKQVQEYNIQSCIIDNMTELEEKAWSLGIKQSTEMEVSAK